MKIINPAYLAGVVDSDGSLSICIQHKNRPNVVYSALFQLTWSINDRTITFFNKLIEQYGGSYSVSTPSSKNSYPNTKQVIHYSLSSAKIVPFIKDILPHLQLKRKQAINILRLRTFTFQYNKYNPKPQRIKDFHAKLYKLNKEFNTKNGSIDENNK